MPLSDSQIRRYSRHILLPDIGGTGQQRLLEARASVTISDGSAAEVVALAYLAAAGVGTLVLAGDAGAPVTATDARLGILYGQSDIGRPRIDALRERLEAINPDVEVTDTGSAPGIDIGQRATDVASALVAGGDAALRFVAEVAR